MKLKTFLVLAPLFLLIAVGYSNCMPSTVVDGVRGVASLSSGAALVCEQDLRAAFSSSYRPVLNDSGLCLSCHSDGGVSPYKFSSQDLNTSFATFMQLGANRVDANAVSPSHAPPRTGSQVQARITQARAVWDPAYQKYQSCLSSAGPGSGPVSVVTQLAMDAKVIPELYFGDGRTVRVSWILDTEVQPTTARFQGLFSVAMRITYATVNGQRVATGYAFSNPQLQMLTGELEAEVEGVVVTINGTQPAGTEPFLSARKTARGIDPTTIYSGEIAVAMNSVSSSDQIRIGFGFLNLRSRTDNPPLPPTPTLAIANAFTRVPQVNVQISNDSTARRWCLTPLPQRPSSAGEKCPGYENELTTSGWSTTRPTNVNLGLLGRAPNQGEVVTLYLWVANSDLKINNAAATAQVTFDTALPASPTLGGVSLGSTQIADLVGLGDSNEPVEWCVREAASQADAESANGCSFSATKPTFVGLRGGGARFVSVVVRDRAGNASRTNVVSVNNTYGRITFQQLSDNVTFGARGVFANKCASCHGLSRPNQASWDSTSYSNSVAKRTQILSRIDSASSTVRPHEFLPEKERALIRLWFTQTSTPVQQ